MFLKKVKIEKYRNLDNMVIDFEKNDFPPVFSIASSNGGGKSTLLQFVFTMLHCFIDDKKKQYIQNLLATIDEVAQDTALATFVIEDKGSDYELAFSIAQAETAEANYNLFLDLDETRNKLNEERKNGRKNQKLRALRDEAKNAQRVTPLLERNFLELRHFIHSSYNEQLYIGARHSKDIDLYRSLIENIFTEGDFESDSDSDNVQALEALLFAIENDVTLLQKQMSDAGRYYITHQLNDKNVILLQTDMPKAALVELSNNVYLTAPNSQIFLFFSQQDKQRIFKTRTKNAHSDISYEDIVQEAKEQLAGFSTYDHSSTELVLKSFEQAFAQDRKIKLQTQHYGTHYDQLAAALNDFLEGKKIAVDEDFERVVFSLKSSGRELQPEDLSHGELKKLGLYIWLKYIVNEGAIVLMDEIDIALHPKWQYLMTKELPLWSKDSQFLLATHSPQILSSTYYKNLIKLENTETGSQVIRYAKPPIDRDINATVTAVMGATDLPEHLKTLHKAYRALIDDAKVDSPQAKALKEQILEHESENSAFFQDINFDLDLM